MNAIRRFKSKVDDSFIEAVQLDHTMMTEFSMMQFVGALEKGSKINVYGNPQTGGIHIFIKGEQLNVGPKDWVAKIDGKFVHFNDAEFNELFAEIE